jgi:hypothetical protein
MGHVGQYHPTTVTVTVCSSLGQGKRLNLLPLKYCNYSYILVLGLLDEDKIF